MRVLRATNKPVPISESTRERCRTQESYVSREPNFPPNLFESVRLKHSREGSAALRFPRLSGLNRGDFLETGRPASVEFTTSPSNSYPFHSRPRCEEEKNGGKRRGDTREYADRSWRQHANGRETSFCQVHPLRDINRDG